MIDPRKMTPWVTLTVITLIGVGYFVFLYASWHQFQQDKLARDERINALLDKIPKPADGT